MFSRGIKGEGPRRVRARRDSDARVAFPRVQTAVEFHVGEKHAPGARVRVPYDRPSPAGGVCAAQAAGAHAQVGSPHIEHGAVRARPMRVAHAAPGHALARVCAIVRGSTRPRPCQQPQHRPRLGQTAASRHRILYVPREFIFQFKFFNFG